MKGGGEGAGMDIDLEENLVISGEKPWIRFDMIRLRALGGGGDVHGCSRMFTDVHRIRSDLES